MQGTGIHLSFPSVGATENILLAAVTAKGVTTIHNAAREPEIQDLANYLNTCGGRISGAGESTIVIHGVPALHGGEHTILPDRIAAATLLASAAATGGQICLKQAEPNHLRPVLSVLEESGCRLQVGQGEVSLVAPPRLSGASSIRTMPYPGFPTDAQSPIMAMLLRSNGATVFVENIFESRFKHVDELIRLGADIQDVYKRQGLDTAAPVTVGESLTDAIVKVEAADLSYEVYGDGDTVLAQSPEPGVTVPSGGTVVLFTDEDSQKETVEVPNLVGFSYSETNDIAASYGLQIKVTGVSSGNASGVSSSQSIAKGEKVKPGTVITVNFITKDTVL